MRVVVIGNIAHIVVHLPTALANNGVGDRGEAIVQLRLGVGVGRGAVYAPDNHRYEAYFAVSDPAQFVVEVARRNGCRLAEITRRHCTCTVTLECQGTIVPAAGDCETTFFHVPF